MADREAGTAAAPSQRLELLVLTLIFAATRLAYLQSGAHPDDPEVVPGRVWHALDVNWLANDLWRSLLHLHSQPPLYNLILGLYFKFGGAWAVGLMQLSYLGVGWGVTALLYDLARRLGASVPAAATTTALYAAGPAALAFELWLFYPLLEAFLLLIAAHQLHEYVSSGRDRPLAVFLGSLGTMLLLRSYFHPLWYLAGTALALHLRPRAWRRAVALVAIPLMLSVGWSAKNWALFGVFSGSSWLGMSLSRITIQQLPPRQRRALVREGALSPLARKDSFQPLHNYAGLAGLPGKVGVLALDEPRKWNRRPNFNHLAYVDLSRRYLADALAVIRRRPDAYWTGIKEAVRLYFRPVNDDRQIQRLTAPIARYDRIYGRIVYGAWDGLCVFVLVGQPLLLSWAIASGFRAARQGDATSAARASVLLFVAFNTLYVFAATSLVEVGENFRFRFAVEPLLTLLVGLLGLELAHRVRRHCR